MTARIFLIAAISAATSLASYGQSKVLVLASRVTDNEYTFGRNALSPAVLSQRVLTATDPKRMHIAGLSPLESVLRVSTSLTALTGNITSVTGGSGSVVVITSANHLVRTGDKVVIADVGGFTAANNTWFATKIDANSFSLVNSTAISGTYTSGGTWGKANRFITNDTYGSAGTEGMRVSGLTIDGQRYADQGTLSGAPDVADGIDLMGLFCSIEGNLIKQFHGAAVVAQAGQRVRDNIIQNSFTGIEVASSDTQITDNIVHGMRDNGIHINGPAAHTYIRGNHFYGMPYPFRQTLGDWSKSEGNMYADGQIGVYQAAGHGSTYDHDYFQRNKTRCIYVTVTACKFSNCRLLVQHKVDQSGVPGVTGNYGMDLVLGADRTRFTGGDIVLQNYSHEHAETNPVAADGAIRLASDYNTIETDVLDADEKTTSKCLVVSGAVKGNRITLNTWDFHGADERLLVIDNIALVDNRFVFQGPGIDTTNPGKYVDVDDDWKLPGSTNSIKLINTTTGAEADLVNQAY